MENRSVYLKDVIVDQSEGETKTDPDRLTDPASAQQAQSLQMRQPPRPVLAFTASNS